VAKERPEMSHLASHYYNVFLMMLFLFKERERGGNVYSYEL